jgi:SHS family sialic acid transporter-like MFS transporter
MSEPITTTTTTTTPALNYAAPTDMTALSAEPPSVSSRAQWLVLLAAFLGWMFDGVEQGIFPQIARPALTSLLPGAAEGHIGWWQQVVDALFLLGAATGGLVFGWLGDKVGRVRAMSASILVYSLFTGLGYFAQAPWHLGGLRFLSAVGMGGEWSLGVALVMEVWPTRLRPLLAGVIGAAANVGFLTIAFVCYLFPVRPDSWRWIMVIGALPALLTFGIRLFVPESHRWKAAQQKAPSAPLKELFAGRSLGLMALAIVFASVPLLATWGAVQKIPSWVAKLPADHAVDRPSAVAGMLLGAGAIVGCLIAPLVGARLGRRPAYFLLCLFALIGCGVLFRGMHRLDGTFWLMTFVVGGLSAAFYGWLPLYLPELFPTRFRATAQGLAYNSGRVLAAAGALAGGQLVALWGDLGRMAATLSLIYLLGMVVIWFAPETKGRPLPE